MQLPNIISLLSNRYDVLFLFTFRKYRCNKDIFKPIWRFYLEELRTGTNGLRMLNDDTNCPGTSSVGDLDPVTTQGRLRR